MLKLHHLVDDKIHTEVRVRTLWLPSSLWAVKLNSEASVSERWKCGRWRLYGDTHPLQEILTVKSDDIVGRVKTYEAIVKGENIPEPGIPESFRITHQGNGESGLDVKVLTEDNEEIEIKAPEMEGLSAIEDIIDSVPMWRMKKKSLKTEALQKKGRKVTVWRKTWKSPCLIRMNGYRGRRSDQ